MKKIIRISIHAGFGLLFSISTVVVSTPVQAGMYKWTDAEGNVHYSQQRPRDAEYERIKKQKAPRPGTASPTPSSTSSAGAADTEQDQASKTVAEEISKNAEIRKKNCEAAKKNLKVFQIYRRVKGEDGKIRVVSEKERAEQIQRSKEAIREFCD
jgi:hypothetical protein